MAARVRGPDINKKKTRKSKKDQASAASSADDEDPENVQEDICPDCKVVTTLEYKSMNCGVCKNWFHTTCQKITNAVYDVIRTDKNGQLSWNCNHCCLASKSIRDSLDLLTVGHVQLAERVDAISEKQINMEQRINTVEQKMDGSQTISPTTTIRELNDRMKRQDSLVIYNIVESESETPETRKSHDKTQLVSICNKLGMDELPSNKFIIRIGAKTNQQGPRPIKVKFQSIESAKNLLSKWRVLTKENKRKMKISIVPDLTVLQRQEGKELRKLRDEKQGELQQQGVLNYYWAIDYDTGKLVKLKINRNGRGINSSDDRESEG